MYTRDEYNTELLVKADKYAALAVANGEEPDTQLTDLIGRVAGCKAHRDLAGEDAAIDQLRRVLVTRYIDEDQLPEAPGRVETVPPVATQETADRTVEAAEGLAEDLAVALNTYQTARIEQDEAATAKALRELRSILTGCGYTFPA